MPVAAAAGRAAVEDESHRRGVRSMLSRMVCGAGRWLSGIALQIGCTGELVLIRTNLVRTMCWMVVVGYAGVKLPRAGSLVRDGVVSRECVRR